MANRRKNFLSMMFIACDDFVLNEDKITFYFDCYSFVCDYWDVYIIFNDEVIRKFTYLEVYSSNYKIPCITLEIKLSGNIKQYSYLKEGK